MTDNPLKTRPESVRGRKPITVHMHPIVRAYLDAAQEYTGLPVYLLIEKAVLNAIPAPHKLFIDEPEPDEDQRTLTAFLADLYEAGEAPADLHAVRDWDREELRGMGVLPRNPKEETNL